MNTLVVAPFTGRGYRPISNVPGMPSPKSSLEYHVVDVFTETAFEGNPLAVVLGGEALSAGQMQRVAREFHLSETAFALFGEAEVVEAGADYRLRIFTPEVELPFAGHPSVGAAWLLVNRGIVSPRDGAVVQLCGEGALRVETDARGATLTGGATVVGPSLPADLWLSCVGLTGSDLVDPDRWPPRICSSGLPFVIVRVSSGALPQCAPVLSQLRDDLPRHGLAGVYVVAWDDLVDGVDARMFAGDVGVAEDPATGSAALALGAYLWAGGALPHGGDFAVRQGVSMGRPSLLRVRVGAAPRRIASVAVRGGVVHVAEGRLVPPAA
jgi:trans-2,3-dihydro-3-hydroxyanthranilate isomerase